MMLEAPKTNKSLETWETFARAFNELNKTNSKIIKQLGLTQPQFSVIETLGNLGPMKIGRLNSNMLYNGGNMTIVLDQLENSKLIRRINSPTDRRAIIIELTEDGQKLFNGMYPNHASHIGKMMGRLSENEQSELNNLLKKLLNHNSKR
ncbi:MAG: MarR family transcriptional regulator [Ignavibacteriae bacterium HGW-Ignavibacteriae-2]|nr:MAG: MarR family transcriptional regulator [Ignavibacteriae bacterium HGW-Ignavibacteriae-2]